MEPDVSIEGGCMIRIAVLPIGAIPQEHLRTYVSMLNEHQKIELSSISCFYMEHQKSPFTNQPWESGSLRFKFMLGGSPLSPWEDFQSSRKILSVIGLCHCPSSPDLALVSEQFEAACKVYTSSLINRCFAFSPSDSQLEDGGNRGNNITVFPHSDGNEQEVHLQTVMQGIAASLLMEFEKWVLHAESAGTILKTPLDSQASISSEEVMKAKKRRLGRAQKTIGDYCLLAGSPTDANAHYNTAIELARLTGDVFWLAGAMEGSVCALLIDQVGHKDPGLVDEVRSRYYSVIQHYRKSHVQDNVQRVSTVSFELEAALKLARFLCRPEMSKDVTDLLMGAADGAKSLIDASDQMILYVEIARLFASLGYQRKAAFFSRQVAQLYLQQDNYLAAISAMQVLAITSKAYRVQRKVTELASRSNNDQGCHPSDLVKMQNQSIVSLFESQWSTIQMVVLREILISSIRAGDPLTTWSAAARLLRNYYPLITPGGQSGLASSLAKSAERLPLGTRCADPSLPFIRLHSVPIHASQLDIVKRCPGKEEWWSGSAPSGPFIYTPFSKGITTDGSKQEIIWIVGEPVLVLVELANPCSFQLVVDSIYLSFSSGNVDAFPISVNLPPNSAKVISLSGVPTSVGPVTIPGCIVHCFGVVTEHIFQDVDNLLIGVAQGLVLSDPFRCCGSSKLKNVTVPSISVLPPLPLLVSQVVGGDGAVILYEGEIREVLISLANAGSVPLEQAHISVSGKNQDSIISLGCEKLKSVLPLKPGAKVVLPVTIKAWHLNVADSETFGKRIASGSSGRVSREGSSPVLVIHYAGPLTYPDDDRETEPSVTHGRRLVVPFQVCVLQGLSLVKARLLSMEIPAYVSENLPKPEDFSKDLNGCNSLNDDKIDRLVKIDPYRGSWGLRLLELEFVNPTDVAFVISVCVQTENPCVERSLSFIENATGSLDFPETRIEREYSSRVLIPLDDFKLPVLDGSFLGKDNPLDETFSVKSSSTSEKNSKNELNSSIKNMISKIKVKWQSGRNSSGELNIKDAIQAALRTSIMDILLPDPLTFGFRLAGNGTKSGKVVSLKETNSQDNLSCESQCQRFTPRGSVFAREMIYMEVLVRNNTKEMIKMRLSVTCRNVAGENCLEGDKATVLWAGVISGIHVEVPPLQEKMHLFSLYFLVPGEYTLIGAAVIEDPTDVLRTRARTDSPEEPIFCRGPPFHVRVVGTI